MSHRGTAHAARRRYTVPLRPLGYDVSDGRHTFVSPEWDTTTYDDVIPHRLRGTLRLADDGEPASLTDLVADVRLA